MTILPINEPEEGQDPEEVELYQTSAWDCPECGHSQIYDDEPLVLPAGFAVCEECGTWFLVTDPEED